MIALMLLRIGAPLVLLASISAGSASADKRDSADMNTAHRLAAKAEKALGKGDPAKAVELSERAVAVAPRDAKLRTLLGRSYLRAGRFTSARTALEEAIELDPQDAASALNLVLAQIATGDWAAARKTLATYMDVIPSSDVGLALALTGDPANAVRVLTKAAQLPGADAKTRQNLALSLALAGEWGMAKAVASVDVPPGDVDRRMAEWAAFAQPAQASDQIAALLGVTQVADAGRPAALALNASVQAVAAADDAAGSLIAVQDVPEAAPPAPAARPAAAPVVAKVIFGPRREVVQPLPVELAKARPTTPGKARTAQLAARAPAPATPAKGAWFVQLGAFDSVGVAKDAWTRAQQRMPALKAHVPTGSGFSNGKGGFYRLSVGGFARADAVAMCVQYRTRGGACFVRPNAGDKVAAWVKPGRVQLAMR